MVYYIQYKNKTLGQAYEVLEDAENKLIELQRVFKNIEIVQVKQAEQRDQAINVQSDLNV